MSYFEKDVLEQARSVDLLSYLQSHEPGELVHVSGDTYCTKEHDSLRISNGKWYWFSRGIGGKSALDYLINVREYTLPQAVELIMGNSIPTRQYNAVNARQDKPKELLMPPLTDYPGKAAEYLKSRGISPVIVDYCVKNGLLFESEQYNNAVFAGYDKSGKMRYAALRSTFSKYKGEVTGSDKHYSFNIVANPEATKVHVFESAIDLLSFATIELIEGRDWKQDALLSLAGVFLPKRENVVPVALSRFLSDYSQIKELHLHLDNDEVGRGATAGIIGGLGDKYTVIDEPPTYGKDANDQLRKRVGLIKEKECER